MESRCVDPHHVQRANLDLLDRVFLGTERTVAEDLDRVLAAGVLRQLVPHELHCHVGREVLVVHVSGPEGARLRARCHCGQCRDRSKTHYPFQFRLHRRSS